ncbi:MULTISPECIES: copper resistance protein NlpE [Sphingobacterium]|uniref:Copper resistance protein NlpE N-terminal domain-containing protein n=1 Tax=Sphingobacterium hotanense TaxID=649196 RepID=A0ABT7NIW0_9SPHI|nr:MULTISPECIES: copper resistance protein NlpE [Sphingobacterium]MCT1523283.1 copper resistance protein NlpE [Sphingobacterium hotanense]MDM1047125.1 copper resistance protein NlpE N-terminal domain-containing protein [Sphingobacterium hotanense]
MQKLSYILIVVIGLIFAISCINNKTNVNQLLASEDNALKGIGLLGTYEGNLPCADCTMISTLLSLDKNKNYHLRYVYVGKSEEVFERTGKWKVDKDILSLENVDYNYKILDNQLNQLDLSGKEIKGDLAEKYTLMKIK